MILLHKKLMDKKGSAKRRAKKYYTDQYKKTGVIPKPLQLAGQGIMEGRKCSGRPPAARGAGGFAVVLPKIGGEILVKVS